MSSKKTKSNSGKQVVNPLEALRDAGSNISSTVNQEVVSPMVTEAWRQLFGIEKRKVKAEFGAGGSIEMSELLSGKQEQIENERKQVRFERRIFDEERSYVEQRTNEVRLQISAIHQEIIELAKATPELDRQVEIAAFTAPQSTSVYEVAFLSQLLSFIKSFRKKIENASSWLATFNSRSSKKNMWGTNYKKHGAKYLLSGEHYLQRSAG